MKKVILIIIFIFYICLSSFQIFNVMITEVVWLPNHIEKNNYDKKQIQNIIIINTSLFLLILMLFIIVNKKYYSK